MTVAIRLAERDRFISVAHQMSNWVDQVLGVSRYALVSCVFPIRLKIHSAFDLVGNGASYLVTDAMK